jgi:hypothetical protein
MSRRIRVPGLLDLTQIDDPTAIRMVSEDQRLDRDFSGGGPLFNRLLTRRIRRVLHANGTPLSAVAPRAFPGRAERQARLEHDLAELLIAGRPAPAQIDRLADYVRGRGDDRAIGPIIQEAIGQLFAKGYQGTERSWRAACILDAAPRSRNPFRMLLWALTGAVGRSRRHLSQKVDDNPAAVHATGIAVHSVAASLRAMRDLWREKGVHETISAEAAVASSLRAPETVLRRWSERAMTIFGDVQPGALMIFELDAARARMPGPQTIFMAESWTRCPAHRWTAELLLDIWQHAGSRPRPASSRPPGASIGAAP